MAEDDLRAQQALLAAETLRCQQRVKEAAEMREQAAQMARQAELEEEAYEAEKGRVTQMRLDAVAACRQRVAARRALNLSKEPSRTRSRSPPHAIAPPPPEWLEAVRTMEERPWGVAAAVEQALVGVVKKEEVVERKPLEVKKEGGAVKCTAAKASAGISPKKKPMSRLVAAEVDPVGEEEALLAEAVEPIDEEEALLVERIAVQAEITAVEAELADGL